MPKLFEIFGFRVSDRSEQAASYRSNARCPFMNQDCDGGGNRYSSQIDLASSEELAVLYPGRTKIPSCVCSIQLHEGESPWIVCPRRLLVLGREGEGERRFQVGTEISTLQRLGYANGTRLGIWSEVKLKYREETDDLDPHSFDYTFDYILIPVGRSSESEIEISTGISWRENRPQIERAGYTLTAVDGIDFVDDFPQGAPSIIEIMTSSTSGGNKRIRSTISMAFEDTLLGRPHLAPGINYRQVWARMVSQLIVKSEIGLNWGGKTIWVVQDNLIHYISSTTQLDVRRFIAERSNEVNMLSFSYGRVDDRNRSGVLDLIEPNFYAGPMRPESPPGIQPTPSFQDIIRAPFCPPLSRLLAQLAKRRPDSTVVV